MKILKLIKNNIIGLVIGVATALTISATAATLFASSDVSYDNTNSGAISTDVQGALDELYELANAKEYYDPYAVGTPIYYNPVSGAKCFDYVSDNSLNENVGATTDTQCMKWYIIGEDTDTIDMILDHDTTYRVAWNSSGSDSSGPSELLTELSSDTGGWTGVPVRTDSYKDPAYGYTISYSGYRARLITANEIAKITGADKILKWDSAKSYGETIGNTASYYYFDGKYGIDSTWQTKVATGQGTSKYAWLYDYTVSCTQYGCNIDIINDGSYRYSNGYWTSSASVDFDDNAWTVNAIGDIGNTPIVSTSHGLRPVITISKP